MAKAFTGYGLILGSSFFFCIQNVVVRVMLSPQTLPSGAAIGGYLMPTLSASFLLLVLRMGLAVPLMGVISSRLYPPLWSALDFYNPDRPQRWAILRHSLLGGLLMFSYLACLYLSLGLIATGVAMTLFFTFPVFTALFSWYYFGQRPTPYRWLIMVLVMVGSGLTIPPESFLSLGVNGWGIGLGIAAGLTYALYTVNAQQAFHLIHPIPFTWLSFALTFLLSGAVVLLFPPPEMVNPSAIAWTPIAIGSLISGIVTFGGHALYNSGIPYIGATVAAMVGSLNPALTVLLAWGLIQETLAPLQLLGVILVTASVAALGLEPSQPPAPTEG